MGLFQVLPTALPCSYELQAATRPPGGRFGAPELVAVPHQSGDLPSWLLPSQVQIASDGTVVVLWREGLSCMYCFGTGDVKAARRRPGQPFGSTQTLGHVGASGPWLVFDADDRALALWGDANTERDAVDLNPRVFGAEAPRHETFERGRPLEHGGDAVGIASGGGGAIAAWTRNDKVMAAVHRQAGLLSAADLPAVCAVRGGCWRQPGRRCGCRLARSGTRGTPEPAHRGNGAGRRQVAGNQAPLGGARRLRCPRSTQAYERSSASCCPRRQRCDYQSSIASGRWPTALCLGDYRALSRPGT